MQKRITFSNIILIVLAVFLFSYNFHTLWLVYDLSLIYFLFKINIKAFINNNKKYLFILLLLLIFFVFSLYRNGLYLISFISFWDTFKHVILLIYFIQNKDKLDKNKIMIFKRSLFKILSISFLFQFVFIFIQTFILKISDFDNISGFLGDGSTHAIGLFVLLLILSFIYQGRIRLLYLYFPFMVLINIWGRNEGFFILLLTMVSFFLLKKIQTNIRYLKKYFSFIVFGTLLLLSIIVIKKDVLIDYFSVVYVKMDAYLGVFQSHEQINLVIGDKVKTGRGSLLNYSIFLGEEFGKGFGAYSSIYNQKGWLIGGLLNNQISISEASHLISEMGTVGFLLTILLYVFLISDVLNKKNIINFWVIFFIMNIFYNRFLMDERHIFIFIIMILVISISDKGSHNKQLN